MLSFQCKIFQFNIFNSLSVGGRIVLLILISKKGLKCSLVIEINLIMFSVQEWSLTHVEKVFSCTFL